MVKVRIKEDPSGRPYTNKVQFTNGLLLAGEELEVEESESEHPLVEPVKAKAKEKDKGKDRGKKADEAKDEFLE